MGQTVRTKMKSGNLTSQGDTHLKSAVLALRGDFRLSIPLSEINSVVDKEGKNANIKDVDVMHAARKVGLVDNKVVSFSKTHTALKLEVPKSQRAN